MKEWWNFLKQGLLGLFILIAANLLWYLIISFIDGEWDISKWYLNTRGWGRFILIVVEACVVVGAAETLRD